MKGSRLLAYLVVIIITVACISGCKPDIDPDSLSLGNLNFSQYVALGDEYTAGFANNGLYESSQNFSFPMLFAEQLDEVRFTNFNQPILKGSGTGYIFLDELRDPLCQEGSPEPVIKVQASETDWEESIPQGGPFHNLGIPDLDVQDVGLPSSTLQNPYLLRLNRVEPELSYLDLISSSNADLMSIWLGVHSFIAYAKEGADNPELLPASSEKFEDSFRGILTEITQRDGVHLMILNLPDVTHFPYFKTLEHQYLDKQSCTFRSVFIEATSPGGEKEIRLAGEDDLLLLSARNLLGEKSELSGLEIGLSPEEPLTGNYVLDRLEVDQIQSMIDEYNEKIRSQVNQFRDLYQPKIVFIDIFDLFRTSYQSSLVIDGLTVDQTYLTGGLFSIDGWTLSPRGNAVVAYRMIEMINNQYFAKIPLPVIADFEGVVFP